MNFSRLKPISGVYLTLKPNLQQTFFIQQYYKCFLLQCIQYIATSYNRRLYKKPTKETRSNTPYYFQYAVKISVIYPAPHRL